MPQIIATLRTAALITGYGLPMLILVVPIQIPSRLLWSSLSDHRGAADLVLLLLCLALVGLAQWRPSSSVKDDDIPSLPMAELFEATRGFHEGAELGRGGFGIVYGTRGGLPSLSRVGRCAVKRLHDGRPEALAGLRKEIGLLAKCRHENLCPLLGVCLDARALCLVYPMLTGGTLDDRLHHRSEAARRRIASLRPVGQHFLPQIGPLGWRDRLRIVRDAARALLYLHTPDKTRGKGVVLHRDVKPTNILLDEQLNAKLADVELATEAHELSRPDVTHVSSRTLVGTAGYVDPLYANTGHYSQMTDGYALGISLLVCLTGKPALEALDASEGMLEEPSRSDVNAFDPQAGWPEEVATELVHLVVGLAWRRSARQRMALADALARIEALADANSTRPGIAAASGRRAARVRRVHGSRRAPRYRCGHCVACEACTLQLERCPSCRVAPIEVVARGATLAFEESFVATPR